jgi:cytoskeletal protein RodZ
MSTPSTPAGWYPDPDGSGGQRYWDGFAWTSHLSPAVAAPEEPGAGTHRAPEPEPAPSEPSFETPSYEPAPAAPPAFSVPPAPSAPDNRKLIIGFVSAVGALLLALVLVLVYAFVIRDDSSTQITASGTSTSSSKTTSSEPSETESETPSETETESPTAAAGDEVTEGDFAFSVASTDSGDTVTSPINEYIEKTATGQFIVVYLNVGNTGSAPLTFLSTLQVLNTDTGTFSPDDEASFYLGGGVVTVNPGEQVETAIAFDVPVDASPVSILVHGEPGGAGVDLPL